MQPPAPNHTVARQLALACQGKTPNSRPLGRSDSKGSSSSSVKTSNDDFTPQDEKDLAAIQALFDANYPDLADDTTHSNSKPTLTNTPESTQRRKNALCSRSSSSDDDELSKMMDEANEIYNKHFVTQPEQEIEAFFQTNDVRQQKLNQIANKWNQTELSAEDQKFLDDIEYDLAETQFLEQLNDHAEYDLDETKFIEQLNDQAEANIWQQLIERSPMLNLDTDENTSSESN